MVPFSLVTHARCRRTAVWKPALSLGVVRWLAVAVLAGIAGCESRGAPALPDIPFGSATEVLRIGAIDDPDLAFDGVTALEIGPDGSIYSLHEREARIRRWSPSGEPLGSIGRRGEGPGEFESPRYMGWRGDSLWVVDESRSYRISFFDEDDSYLGALTPGYAPVSIEQHGAGIYPARSRGLLGDGTIHGETIPGAPVPPGTPIRVEHVRMRRDGSTIDTVLHVTIGPESFLRLTTAGGLTYGSQQPFADGLLVAPASDGMSFLVVQRSASDGEVPATFHLYRIALNGDTLSATAHPYHPVAIPADSIERHIQERVETLTRFTRGADSSPGELEALVREALHTPSSYPPVEHLVPGRDGTVWLSIRPERGATREWLVLADDGAPIGRVELPVGVRVMMAERSALWGIVSDEYGVDYIVRYRVELPEIE